MRLKPVNLGFPHCSIGKLHGGSSFPLAPATFAVRAVQIEPDVHPRPVAIVSMSRISPRISNSIIHYCYYDISLEVASWLPDGKSSDQRAVSCGWRHEAWAVAVGSVFISSAMPGGNWMSRFSTESLPEMRRGRSRSRESSTSFSFACRESRFCLKIGVSNLVERLAAASSGGSRTAAS